MCILITLILLGKKKTTISWKWQIVVPFELPDFMMGTSVIVVFYGGKKSTVVTKTCKVKCSARFKWGRGDVFLPSYYWFSHPRWEELYFFFSPYFQKKNSAWRPLQCSALSMCTWLSHRDRGQRVPAHSEVCRQAGCAITAAIAVWRAHSDKSALKATSSFGIMYGGSLKTICSSDVTGMNSGGLAGDRGNGASCWLLGRWRDWGKKKLIGSKQYCGGKLGGKKLL